MPKTKKSIADILFIDIETAGISPRYEDLDKLTQQLWKLKCRQLKKSDLSASDISDLYLSKAAIYAEFAKVICISIGYFEFKNGQISRFKTKSFYGTEEKQILRSFTEVIKKYFDLPDQYALCGHNIKEFDVPFISRRLIINQVQLPNLFDIGGKKPWELAYLLDTMQLWKFGDFKAYTSLRLLAHVLGIPSPKDEIDGSMVHDLFWNTKMHKQIVKYCEGDVFTVAMVYLRLQNIDISSQLKRKSATSILNSKI